jgi:hypothetical protein
LTFPSDIPSWNSGLFLFVLKMIMFERRSQLH